MQVVQLVVVLMLSDGTTAGRATLLDTLARSLDPSLVQVQPRVLGDAAPEVLEALSQTHAVVEIRWESPRQATIRAALKPSKWTSRRVEFGPKDPLVERAKTLGFAVAAMLPQWRAETPVANPPPLLEVVPLSESDFVAWSPAADAGVEPELVAIDAGVGPETVAVAMTVEEPKEEEVAPPAVAIAAPPAPDPVRETTRAFISVHASGQLPQLLGGGGIDGAYCVVEWLCLGAQLTFGGGSLSTVSHLELRTVAMADVRIYPWRVPLGLTARGTGGAVMIAATRGTETISRWTGTGGVEAGLAFRAGRFELTFSGGPTFSGPTRLFVDGVQLGEIAAVQGTLRLGGSWRF